MARHLFSLSVALATAAALVGSSSIISAQPAISSSAAASPAAKPPNYPELETAQTQFNKGDIPGALKTLHEAGLKYQELPSEFMMLYRVCAQAKQGNAAMAFLERGLTDTPSDPEPWIVAGDVSLSEGRVAQAELDYAKAIQQLESYKNATRKNGLQVQALSGMALVAERRGRWDVAQKWLDKILEVAPDDVVAWQRHARAQFWQDRKREAYDDLKKAKKLDLEFIDKNPKAPERVYPPAAILAQYYDMFQHEKDNEKKLPFTTSKEAKQWFTFALGENKDDLNLRRVVCVWALENGDLQLAEEQAKEALRIEKANPVKYAGSPIGKLLNGYVALWKKDWPNAEDYFKDLLYDNPNDPGVKNNLALALVEQPVAAKKEKALALAFGNYQNNKENLDALTTLMWIYFKTEKFDLANSTMESVVRGTNGNISNADTATYMAHILYHNADSHNGLKLKTKQLLDLFINSKKPFSMEPEARKLYESVKNEKAPEPTTPTASATKP